MKLAGFRLVVVAVFGGNYAQLDQKPARSVSSEFEDEGNVKRGDRGDFYSSACLDFAEGNPGVLERATCPDRVPFGVTSRCPTPFLLFTRFLVARSRRAIPSSLALRAFLRAFRLPLLPGLSTATFARVRCEECDTPRFTTRTREMRKRGGGCAAAWAA